MYTHVDLFTGIGGFTLACEIAGFITVTQVEYDKYCTQVLSKLWPNVVKLGDVRGCGRHNLPFRPTLLTAGFPCQPFSYAGRRKGSDDERFLWPEVARIIKEIQPRIVFLENVPGILSIGDGAVFRGILQDLASSGYDAEWRCISASAVGAPHGRKRWWCVAYSQSAEWRPGYPIPCQMVGESRLSSEREETSSGDGVGSAALAHAESSSPTQQPLQPDGEALLIPFAGAVSGAIERHSAEGVPERGRVVASGSADVGNAADERLSQPGQSRQPALETQRGPGLVVQSERSGAELAHSQSVGVQGNWPLELQIAQSQVQSRISGRDSSGSGAENGAVESILGRVFDGLPYRLDGIRRQSRWPSWPGQPQFEWEPPRTVHKLVNRASRLKALGNAIVPQVAIPIAQAIYAYLEETDRQAGAPAITSSPETALRTE